MRRRLPSTERRAISVGCAVNTGVMVILFKSARASSAPMPASRMARRVPRNDPRCSAAAPLICAAVRRRLRWLVSARLVSSK